ncbi:MAG: dihydroorotate dehydrogenase (quinone) [Rhodospirillaceae bacterium]|nr:dihydroorotate dehydrogenase (quinone) [Rhodospirillaceae bacterium]
MTKLNLARSILSRLPPEIAHALAIKALEFGLGPNNPSPSAAALSQTCFGLHFANPVGLAAGFDKNARGVNTLLKQGFGSVEVGTITPKAQKGNTRPRLFRLPEDGAVINRLGFNNEGLEIAARRLSRIRPYKGIIGANIGPNRNSENPLDDYRTCLTKLAPLVDYLVVNISSPNTPGLRAWQSKENLHTLISTLQDKRAGLTSNAGQNVPLLIKLAPDLDRQSRADIAAVAIKCKVDGLLISNTTLDRPASLIGKNRAESGGLSGQPLFERSTQILADMYKRVNGDIALIGIGGVASGQDAYKKIRAGASIIQLYTALIYKGPELIEEIKSTLSAYIKRDGFPNITSAIGVDVSKY